MGSEWIGVIGVLLGASVTGTLAVILDRVQANAQRERDQAQRAHDVSERRYQDRRDAYVAFASACMKAMNSTDEYEEQHGVLPGENGYDGRIQSLLDALGLVQIIGPDEIAQAAVKASQLLHSWTFDGPATRADASEAVDAYVRSTRKILLLDPPN